MMTMLDKEVVVMLEAGGFYFKFGMEISSKTAFWFLFGMNISNTIHFMLFLRKKRKCTDSIYTHYICTYTYKYNMQISAVEHSLCIIDCMYSLQ